MQVGRKSAGFDICIPIGRLSNGFVLLYFGNIMSGNIVLLILYNTSMEGFERKNDKIPLNINSRWFNKSACLHGQCSSIESRRGRSGL